MFFLFLERFEGFMVGLWVGRDCWTKSCFFVDIFAGAQHSASRRIKGKHLVFRRHFWGATVVTFCVTRKSGKTFSVLSEKKRAGTNLVIREFAALNPEP